MIHPLARNLTDALLNAIPTIQSVAMSQSMGDPVSVSLEYHHNFGDKTFIDTCVVMNGADHLSGHQKMAQSNLLSLIDAQKSRINPHVKAWFDKLLHCCPQIEGEYHFSYFDISAYEENFEISITLTSGVFKDSFVSFTVKFDKDEVATRLMTLLSFLISPNTLGTGFLWDIEYNIQVPSQGSAGISPLKTMMFRAKADDVEDAIALLMLMHKRIIIKSIKLDLDENHLRQGAQARLDAHHD